MDLDPELLATAPLTNEEIVALLATICTADDTRPFRDAIQTLTDRYDMTLEMRSLPLQLLSIPEVFDMQMLSKYYTGLQRESYESLIVGVIKWYQTDHSAGIYARKLYQIFQPALGDAYVRDLLSMVRRYSKGEAGGLALDRYMETLLRSVADYAPVPPYIRDVDIAIDHLDRLQETDVPEDLSNAYIAEYIMTQLADYQVFEGMQYVQGQEMPIDIHGDRGYVQQSIKDYIMQQLEKMPSDERREYLRLFRVDPADVDAIQQNTDVFRVYGPVNPYADTDFSTLTTADGSPDVHKVFGGARMFTDMELETMDDYDLPIEDWFVGYCQECNLRIRAYFHAVREPRIRGGWLGCYCSWACAKKRLDEQEDTLTTVKAVQTSLVDEFSSQVAKHGIADRDTNL